MRESQKQLRRVVTTSLDACGKAIEDAVDNFNEGDLLAAAEALRMLSTGALNATMAVNHLLIVRSLSGDRVEV